MTLQPQVTLEPFKKWGMDFIGPIYPPLGQKKYIFVCIDYLTKWAKEKVVKGSTEHKVDEFLRENIFYKVCFPMELGTDEGTQFTSNLIEGTMKQHHINHMKFIAYHPQENGQVEVTNRALENTLTKVVNNIRKNWVDILIEATLAYNTTWKTTNGFTPFELVYGKKALLCIDFEYNTIRMETQLDSDLTRSQQERLL